MPGNKTEHNKINKTASNKTWHSVLGPILSHIVFSLRSKKVNDIETKPILTLGDKNGSKNNNTKDQTSELWWKMTSRPKKNSSRIQKSYSCEPITRLKRQHLATCALLVWLLWLELHFVSLASGTVVHSSHLFFGFSKRFVGRRETHPPCARS